MDRFKPIEVDVQITNERPYLCIRYRATSEDMKAQTSKGKQALLLQVRSLYCQHPIKPELGILISYSQRGGPPDPDLDSQAQSFIEGVQVPDALKLASSSAAPKFSEAVVAAIGPRVEGKARIVFFRPNNSAGALIGFIVREQEVELGKLRNGNYFVVNVEPGKHTYSVHSEAHDDSIYEVEAGETYFIAGSISPGFFAGHPHLTSSNVAAFGSALPRMELSKPLK